MLALVGGNDEQSTVTHFLNTGFPPLNYALSSKWGGGLPVGRIVEMFGPPSAGKTAVSTAAMISAQQQGGFAMFNDHENSFDHSLAENMGLDLAPGRFLYKTPETFEESIDMAVAVARTLRAKKLLAENAPICMVFDSIASMVPMSKMVDKDGKARDASTYNMHDNTALARATSAAFPAFAQYVQRNQVCAIFLNQERTKPGVTYGDPKTTPGGDAPKFYASVRVQLGGGQITKGDGKNKEVLGKEITAKVVKNKVSRPFLTAKWRFEFQDDGSGKFAVARSMIDFLIEQKILKVSGAYVEWTDGKKYHKGPLAEKLEAEDAVEELFKLLPGDYEPEAVGEVDVSAA